MCVCVCVRPYTFVCTSLLIYPAMYNTAGSHVCVCVSVCVQVRVYQFADLSRNVTVTTLTTPLSHEDGNGKSSKKTSKISEDAGLQLKLKSVTHETEITCICYSPAAKALAVADKAGGVGCAVVFCC